MQTIRNHRQVAIVGGGPAGLVAAKSLFEEGLQPTVFEQSSNVGGQWNAPGPHSGVWKTMRANTSKVTMCFSDFPFEEEQPMFLTNQQVHAYLLRYAKRFDLKDCLRLNTRVEMVSRADGGGWLLESETLGERRRTEIFPHVIVASGRFNKPRISDVKGLERFKGTTSHTFDYRGNDQFKEKRVLVIGNSISGLEVASELATDPTITEEVREFAGEDYALAVVPDPTTGDMLTDISDRIGFNAVCLQRFNSRFQLGSVESEMLKSDPLLSPL